MALQACWDNDTELLAFVSSQAAAVVALNLTLTGCAAILGLCGASPVPLPPLTGGLHATAPCPKTCSSCQEAWQRAPIQQDEVDAVQPGWVSASSSRELQSDLEKMSGQNPSEQPEQADECSYLSSCSSCAARWPSCAWCGTSGSCVEAPAELVAHVRQQDQQSHVVFGQEEYRKSFGRVEGIGTSCGIWMFNSVSCSVVQDYCTLFSYTCLSCNRISGCGYCHTTEQPGRYPGKNLCVPGTYSGEITVDAFAPSCGRDVANDAPQQWLYGDWPLYYATGSWDAGCSERCLPWEVFTEGTGELRLGTAERLVSYEAGQQCGWLISPPVGSGTSVKVVLEFYDIAYEGDVLTATPVPFSMAETLSSAAEAPNPPPAPTSATASVGCEPISAAEGSSCWRITTDALVSDTPVLLSFSSVERHGRFAVGAWRVTWEIGPNSSFAGAASGDWSTTTRATTPYMISTEGGKPSDAYPAHTLIVWICIVTMVLPLLGIVFMMLWRWRNPMAPPSRDWQQQAMNFAPIALQGAQAVSIDALERELPSCRPKVIGPSQGSAGDADAEDGDAEDGDATCSVCLCDFEEGEEARELPCKHLFHVPCIDGWLASHFACPLCRRELPASVVAAAPSAAGASQVAPAAAAAAAAAAGAESSAQGDPAPMIVGLPSGADLDQIEYQEVTV